ncbi:MAG: Fic family protein [Clostridia bacterium]|nr:Fic family protein [Clostridia bacterium]
MKKTKIISPLIKGWNKKETVLNLTRWNENIPQDLQLESSFEETLDKFDNVVWLGRTGRREQNATNYYMFNDRDWSEVNWMVNHITLREGEMIEKGYDVKGVKSFNRNTWVDISRHSNAMEGVFEDFEYDLLDFRAQLRGRIAHDPSTKDFDIDAYFLKLLDQLKKVEENNDSVVVIGKNKEIELDLETVRHFLAFKYVYKCAKKYRYKDSLSATEIAKIIQNSACLLSGSEWVEYRNIQVYVNKNGNYDLAKWTPVKPSKILPQMDSLCSWIANENNINPIDKAAIAQAEFVRIHPYFDGNGRVSRLLANFILMKNGVPTIKIRYENTIEYFKALNEAIETHNCNTLINMFNDQVLDSACKINECLDYIEKNQKKKVEGGAQEDKEKVK